MEATDFKKQFLPYHRKLYRTAFLLLGNAQDAEDMVQEAYLKLWKRRNELPSEIANREAYCVTLIKNLCHDALRSRHLKEDGRMPEELPLTVDSNTVLEVEKKDEARQIIRLIEQLPEPQRTVMKLRDIEEFDYPEIEKITQLSPANIRVLLSRARKKIREQFKELMAYERL